jgi:glycosyltransferase involved in cell wall biosynthesis
MDWPKQCMAVIPCLNEARAVGPLVQAVRCIIPAVLVVDDGSADRTASLAQEAGAQVLRHDSPAGKGVALQTGWRHARQSGFQWALCLDGDGQHSPEDIPALFQRAENTSAALVVGNRMAEADQMPWLRRQVNRWMSRQLSNLVERPLPDTQCGFRLMHLEAWSALPITATHFEIESEVLLAFIAAGHVVEFEPVRVIYKDEQSKIHPVRDTFRWLRWWQGAQSRWRSLRATAMLCATHERKTI